MAIHSDFRYNLGMYLNHEKLQNKLNNLPKTPGVYRFLNKESEVLYVGVSKNLSSRVRSYFTGEKEGKIASLVCQIQDLEVELCDTYLEARLLECQRIKEIRPPYNAQFKREKAPLYLKVRKGLPGSILAVTHDPESAVGPFRNLGLLEEVMADFSRLYPLKLSKSKLGQTQVSFCLAILPRRLDAEEFQMSREALLELFWDEELWNRFLQALEEAMHRSAGEELFSEAVFYRDFLERLKLIHSSWYLERVLQNELLFLRIPSARGGVKYFRVRNGKIEDMDWGKDFEEGTFQAFRNSSKQGSTLAWESFPEKARLDFRSILYSEIRSLPRDQVVEGQG